MTRRAILLGLAALALAGCSKSDGPVDPVWGKEPCAHCAMVVGNRRSAAEVLSDGDRYFFDDIGCMVLWLEGRDRGPAGGNGDAKPRTWVRDPQGNAWVDARSARYAPGAHTPMDFGFETTADGGVGWGEMREQVLAKKKGSGL